MRAKFLFGSIRGIKLPKEDTFENMGLIDAIILTRKSDVFQHRDMEKVVGMTAFNGGFVDRLTQLGEEHFHGESVSVGVSTDESMHAIYHPLMKTGEWYQHVHEIDGRAPFTIFMVMKRGYKPTRQYRDLDWMPISYNKVHLLMAEEIHFATGL